MNQADELRRFADDVRFVEAGGRPARHAFGLYPSATDSEAGQHDDGTEFAGHDPVELLQYVHVRHLSVQRNDIGIGNSNKAHSTFRIGYYANIVHTRSEQTR